MPVENTPVSVAAEESVPPKPQKAFSLGRVFQMIIIIFLIFTLYGVGMVSNGLMQQMVREECRSDVFLSSFNPFLGTATLSINQSNMSQNNSYFEYP